MRGQGKVTTTCYLCGKVDEAYPSVAARRHFCSSQCEGDFASLLHMWAISSIVALRNGGEGGATLKDIIWDTKEA
jgi:endogenous inhibitor of DNA gyrase (YacG/DUF329 family)